MQILGIVRLTQGQVGYYDELTRIHLTIASPEKPVLEGMNTTNLKRAVKSGRIKLVSGSLDPETNSKPAAPAPIAAPVGTFPAAPENNIETSITKEEGTIDIKIDEALEKIQAEKVETETPVEAVVESTETSEEASPADETTTSEDESAEEAEASEETSAENADAPVEQEKKTGGKRGGPRKK